MINWRKREDHPEQFEDGEIMLVAIKPFSEEWDFSVVKVNTNGDVSFYLEANNHYWEWSWSDVDYWIPIEKILPQENKLTKGA